MFERIILFGAGASYGARKPSPPLGKCLHGYVKKYLKKKWDELRDFEDDGGLSEQVRQKLNQYLEDTTSYELLANKLLNEKQRELLQKLNFLMAGSMTPPINPPIQNDEPRVDDAFVEKCDVYDDFLRKRILNRQGSIACSFITLNYDCLLERAICRTLRNGPQDGEGQCLCTHVHYPPITYLRNGIEVLKPHGSIHWVGNLTGRVRIGADSRVEYDVQVVRSPLNSISPQDPEVLILANYAPGKEPQANHETFKDVQNLAIERIGKAKMIEIIGVHLPTNSLDDPFLNSLLDRVRDRLTRGDCNVYYVSPDEAEVNDAKSRFNFNGLHLDFEKYANSREL